MLTKELVLPELKRLVEDLVAGNLEAIGADGRIGTLSLGELAWALEDAYGKLTVPPEEAYETADMFRTVTGRMLIEFDLWIDHRRGNLTLQAAAQLDVEGILWIEIEDIRIL